jgi:hypothetical protein
MFGGVERHDANRVAILAGHQVADGGFEIASPVSANAGPSFP